jgi:hypothetical protein
MGGGGVAGGPSDGDPGDVRMKHFLFLFLLFLFSFVRGECRGGTGGQRTEIRCWDALDDGGSFQFTDLQARLQIRFCGIDNGNTLTSSAAARSNICTNN